MEIKSPKCVVLISLLLPPSGDQQKLQGFHQQRWQPEMWSVILTSTACSDHQPDRWERLLDVIFPIVILNSEQDVDFSVVILSEYVSLYQSINWTDWKDLNRKKMRSEGDNWSKAILSGENIWDCLDTNKINRMHLVQWKPVGDVLHRVSLPSHPLASGVSR